MLCPCCSGQPYATCCGPLLDHGVPARTAEALMRSRYTAFARGAIDYLIDTHHPSTRASVDRASVARWSRSATWLGLEVLAVERGGPGDDDGVVEFRASYSESGAERVHREQSTFRRLDGRWCYVDGEAVRAQPAARGAKVGRNDPCPCGSGRKYKKCCG
jgi:SEC-C motif-containing protein